MNFSARDSQYLTKPEVRFGSSMLYIFKDLIIAIMLYGLFNIKPYFLTFTVVVKNNSALIPMMEL